MSERFPTPDYEPSFGEEHTEPSLEGIVPQADPSTEDRPTAEFGLPEDFEIQLITLLRENKYGLSSGSISHHIFGERLPFQDFSKVDEAIIELYAGGLLARLSKNRYSLADSTTSGQAQPEDVKRPRRNLDEMLKNTGIPSKEQEQTTARHRGRKFRLRRNPEDF